MKKYERIKGNYMVLRFLASILFLGPRWDFFFQFSKIDHFEKVHIKKLMLLLNFLLWDFTNSICISNTLKFVIFRFIYCF